MKKLVALLLVLLTLNSCENERHLDKNYVYTFSGVIDKDDYGRNIWGAHHFILDEKIKNMASFKECYVIYLEWSGLDKDGMYKKSYYLDDKNIKIELQDEVWGTTTVKNADLCN